MWRPEPSKAGCEVFAADVKLRNRGTRFPHRPSGGIESDKASRDYGDTQLLRQAGAAVAKIALWRKAAGAYKFSAIPRTGIEARTSGFTRDMGHSPFSILAAS